MKIINYFSTAAIPVIIAIIILYGVIERKKVYDIFLKGAKDGIKIVFQLIPTLIGIFVAVGALRNSGILDLIINVISPLTNFLKIPSEIMPLALLRPISGSASIGVAVDIMQKFVVEFLLTYVEKGSNIINIKFNSKEVTMLIKFILFISIFFIVKKILEKILAYKILKKISE